MEGRQLDWSRIAILLLISVVAVGACLWFAVLPMLGINPANLVAKQTTTVPVSAPSTAAAPTKAPVPGQSAVQATAVVQPTVATAPGQTSAPVATKVPVPVPTSAGPAPSGLLETQFAIINYSPYYDVIGAAAKTAAANGSKITIYTDIPEERQCDWVLNKAPGEYYPALKADELKNTHYQKAPTGVARVLFSTHSSAVLCPGTEIPLWIGQSAGNDVIVVRNNIKTINDICANSVVATAFGSVSEGNYKLLCKSFVPQGMLGDGLKPADDAKPARELWRSHTNYPTLFVWEPEATAAVDCKNSPDTCVQGARYFSTSKTFYGIFDVWITAKTTTISEALKRAMISYFQFQDYAFQNGEDAYNTELAYGQAHPEVMGAFYQYNSFGDVDADRTGEAQFNYQDNLTFATAGLGYEVALQHIKEIQDTFSRSATWNFPTFRRNIPKAFDVPNVPANTIWDPSYILALQGDPRVNGLSAQGATRPMLKMYGPRSTGTTVMGNYVTSDFAFQPGSAAFVDPFGVQDKMNAEVVPILKLTPYVFNVTFKAGDSLGLARIQTIKTMLKNLGVPVDTCVTATAVQDPGASAGNVSFTLVGDPE